MMKKTSLTGFAALILLALFALCTLSVLLSGAGVYRRLVDSGERSYLARTGSRYIGTKIRQSVCGDAVAVAPFGDGDAILLTEDVDGAPYITRIYCHEGWLMELFSDAAADLTPDDGQRLLQAKDLTAHLSDQLLTVGLTDPFDRTSTLRFSLRTGEEDLHGQ